MNAPIEAVDGAGPAPTAASRHVRFEGTPQFVPDHGTPASEETASQAAAAALGDGGSKISLGGRTAEFSYDKELGRVIVRIFSSDVPPREVVRQIPPEDYLAFVSRFREMFGVLFDHQL